MSKTGIRNIFHEDFFSEKSLKKVIVDAIVRSIEKNGVKLSIKPDELYLAVDEALTNAMEHGNEWAPQKKVSINAELSPGTLSVTIKDEGRGFNSEKVQEKLSNSEDKFRHRGRGIFIIRQFCTPRWNPDGTEITLLFDIRQ